MALKYDTVVIGLGGVGSFALRAVAQELAKKKPPTTVANTSADGAASVLGIERFQRCHDQGSSHGHSRIYRKAYFEHSSYVPWVQYSVDEFRKLEENAGYRILHECGVLVVVPQNERKWLDACMESAKLHKIPIETLTAVELRTRFPQYRYPSRSVGDEEAELEMLGVFEPEGGMVRPERAIHAALKEAGNVYGATIWENTIVKSMKEVQNTADGGDPYVRLVVERTMTIVGNDPTTTIVTIEARTVLVAAGAWTSELIPSWKTHLTPIRTLQTWVDVSQTKNPHMYNTPNMPCIVMVNPKLSIPVYCLPANGNSSDDDDGARAIDEHHKYKRCVKLGVHGADVCINPYMNSKQQVTPIEQGQMIRAIQATFCEEIINVTEEAKSQTKPPATLATSCIETKPCMYTMTKDEHFMIGVPKGMKNICAVAGLSGRGFKMTPALGQMLADFALKREATGDGDADERVRVVLEEKWKAGFCSPSRFGV